MEKLRFSFVFEDQENGTMTMVTFVEKKTDTGWERQNPESFVLNTEKSVCAWFSDIFSTFILKQFKKFKMIP